MCWFAYIFRREEIGKIQVLIVYNFAWTEYIFDLFWQNKIVLCDNTLHNEVVKYDLK